MLLQAGERQIRSAYAVIGVAHRPEGVRGPGVLYLTNQRLIFEAPASRGVVQDFLRGRDSHLVFDHTLHEIVNATVRRPRVGRPMLTVEVGGDRVEFDVLEPDEWLSAIAQAKRVFGPAAPAPTTVIERQVVKVRCRYCGSLADEVDGRCPYCGAAL
jgi:hypothetical protein